MKSSTRREISYYLITFILVSVSVIFVYHLWEWNFFRIPFSYSGDGISGLAGVKQMMREGGWAFASDYLGAPFGQVSYDAGQCSYLPMLVAKILILFSGNAVAVMNLSFLSSYVIVALVTLAVLRKLEMDPKVAIAMSVLYACTPFHFQRGIGHYGLAFYATIPLAVYYMVRVMRRNILIPDRHYLNRSNLAWLLAMVLTGLNGIYYAFFSCFFFCVAAVYILINEKKLKRLRDVFLSIFVITATVVAGYLPTVLYNASHGPNTAGIIRITAGVEIYALRLAQLILPISGHRVPFLAALKDLYNGSYTVNENDMASLGLFFAIAFLVLLLYLWKRNSQDKPYLRELACLNLAALIYASSGGLILLQGLAFPMIRCGNRISIFIAFFACVCLGVMLTSFVRKRGLSSRTTAVLMIVLVCLGVLDNTKAAYIDVEGNRTKLESDRAFIKKIDRAENGEGMIWQMPFMEFPENGPVVGLADYSHLAGCLFSDTLRWSYGVFRGRPGSRIMARLGTTEMSEEFLQTLARMGYTGIYIDKRGYEKEAFKTLKEQLRQLLKKKPIVSSQRDKFYFSLKDYIKENHILVDYVAFEFEEGVYEPEAYADDVWRWAAKEGKFMIYNFSDQTKQGTVTMETNPSQEGEYSFAVTGDDEEASFEISQESQICTMAVSLQPGANYFEFETDCPDYPGTDSGEFCMQLRNFAFAM